MDSSRMPVVFVGHGSPLNALEDTSFSEGWKKLGTLLPKPKAILAVSAHYYTRGSYVNNSAKPEQIYDMVGFPDALYQIKYQPKGNPELAMRVSALTDAVPSGAFGIDHGVWSVLRRTYPAADIPVVSLSVNGLFHPQEMFDFGKKLRVLRDEGVLIFGTGSIVHNLSLVNWDMAEGYPWANEFQQRVNEAVVAKNTQALIHIEKDPDAKKAFRTIEHYAPLVYVLGTLDGDEKVTTFNNQLTLGSISMTSFLFE